MAWPDLVYDAVQEAAPPATMDGMKQAGMPAEGGYTARGAAVRLGYCTVHPEVHTARRVVDALRARQAIERYRCAADAMPMWNELGERSHMDGD